MSRAPREKRDAHMIFIEAVKAISSGSNTRDMHIDARHVQSFATLQAAALMAAAIDRNTAAIKALVVDRWSSQRVQTGRK